MGGDCVLSKGSILICQQKLQIRKETCVVLVGSVVSKAKPLVPKVWNKNAYKVEFTPPGNPENSLCTVELILFLFHALEHPPWALEAVSETVFA